MRRLKDLVLNLAAGVFIILLGGVVLMALIMAFCMSFDILTGINLLPYIHRLFR